ncbi:MAG: hypothetical protein PCFJNLEI_02588 [Verrucomicrobiae bacterium]|nr:hypothetical protein [Verrucomicrobiae bacterium]
MQISTFQGPPPVVGTAAARRWRPLWQQVVTRWRTDVPARDSRRVRQFRDLLAAHAPHWLEEAAAFAGDTLADLLDFNCHSAPPPPAKQAGHCSSVLALGRATADGQPLLLKIRDEAPWPQISFRRRLPRGPLVLGGTNPGNLGLATFLNDAGLAGINNSGGPIRDLDVSVGFNDCHVLRWVAERARDCQQALDVIQQLMERRVLGLGGYRKGMILMFADARGGGLVVECSRQKLAHRFLNDGVICRTNDYRLAEMEAEMDVARHHQPSYVSSLARSARLTELVAAAGPLTPAKLKRISRDTTGTYPLCNATGQFPFCTVAAWIHVLRRADPAACRAWICETAPSLGKYRAVPVRIVPPETPRRFARTPASRTTKHHR